VRGDGIFYLCPTFPHYRIPVLNDLAGRWPGRFRVVGLRNPVGIEERRHVDAGLFDRTLVRGRWVPLTRGHRTGRGTPTGLMVAPGVVPLLFRERPRVIVVNNFGPWTAFALQAKRWGARIVICWEGTPHTERSVGRRRRWTRAWMARRADAFVVNGSLARAYVEGLGVAPRRIVEGAMGADVEGVARAARDVPDEWIASTRRELGLVRPTLLTVTRLIAGKGIDYLLAAVATLRERGVTCSLVVVGDGPERRALEAEVRRLGLVEQVRFLGWVPAAEVPRYHRLADVFVLPTLQDNWSLAVVEAMASGLPIVTTPYNGLWPELVREGENGFVVDPERVGELAERLGRFADQSPDQRARMAARSIELVQRCRPERVAASFAEAIRVALAA
jgi:glycosyltransferase involved in cell wall biosynthesis